MNVKLLFALLLFSSQFVFSQKEKQIKGKVTAENSLLQNVDVINKTSKKSVLTDANGEFIIDAKVNDSLIFYAKGFHLQRMKLSSNQADQGNLAVTLFRKPEELEEVVVTTVAPINMKLDKKWELEKRREAMMEKKAKTPKVQGVYDGTIENGIDFVVIGKLIGGALFKGKEKTEKKIVPEDLFTVAAKDMFNEKFYLQTLKLNPDEVNLFLQFCEADPESKKILLGDHDQLSMMDFLMKKNKEFKSLSILK